MDRIDHWQVHVEALTQPTAHVTHQTQALEAHTHTREAQTPMVERRRRWAVRAVLLPVATLLGALGVALGTVTPAHADDIQCGDVLGPGGRFLLEANVNCGTGPALTVRDEAHLDLGGHTIRTESGTVILLDGRGAVVQNGIVSSGGIFGIRVAGDGGHTVRRVSVFAVVGFDVTTDHNRLINNTAFADVFGGFFIFGHHNLLTDNSTGGGQIGFSVSGDHNVLRQNSDRAVGNFGSFLIHGHHNLLIRNDAGANALEPAFQIGGDGNQLVENRSINNPTGIEVSGRDTVITRNTVLDNRAGQGPGRDLIDTHEDCDDNRWRQNVFRTSRAGTMENPACIQNQTPQAHDVVALP